jgi:hypothetical protein
LYSKDANIAPLTNQTIADFLGPEICNNSVVLNSKLTDDEKLFVDRNLSVGELDAAAKEAKVTTAGGPDGIGNACVKKMWTYIRVPLTNYANECIRKGTLTNNFRTALIKSIPKKGDATKIKNWRPISLLNCLYKIISKAINERLKKIANRILSRAQKGFTGGKYIHECLINIISTIYRCNQSNTPAFVLAIDQAKAFDSVRHDFMRKCFEFFEIPEQFIRILEIFTTNRTAAILLDDCKSNEFDLEIGNTQGNGPSPLQFNFCEQILLFKLEFDPRIVSVYCENVAMPPMVRGNPLRNFDRDDRQMHSYESNNETNKVEGFADDGTVMAKATREAVEAIKEVLDAFATISGLTCNIEKSMIMPIGFRRDPVLNYFVNSRFKVVTSLPILGVDITPNFDDLRSNFDKRTEKMIKIKNYWSRFRLSVPGRLAVAKTFMLSQLGYLACIISPSNEQMARMSSVVLEFVRGNMNISNERINRRPQDGGLGMISIDQYITALQAAWIKKINNKP